MTIDPKMRNGSTLTEVLVGLLVVSAMVTIAFSIAGSGKEKAQMALAMAKMQELGKGLVEYSEGSGGLLPYEDSPGTDSWETAAKSENSEVWYNALPRQMGSVGVGDLVGSPEKFYDEDHPIFIPGAPYPIGDQKLEKPYFAVAMNSRLQRKNEKGVKEQGLLSSILEPDRTVAFLERGMPGDDRVNKAQTGFSAGPKANPRDFAARHNQKGILVFIDGHAEVRRVSDLMERGGSIKVPQSDVVWTPDPDDDPN